MTRAQTLERLDELLDAAREEHRQYCIAVLKDPDLSIEPGDFASAEDKIVRMVEQLLDGTWFSQYEDGPAETAQEAA